MRKIRGGQAAELAAMKKVMPVLAHIGQTGGRRRKHMGAGFFSSLWDGIKSVASAAAPLVNDALKSTKIISSGLSMVPAVGNVLSKGASALGYGKRRRKRGKGAFNDMLKKSGIVSTGLQFVPTVGPIASMIAKSQGYGRKKGVVRKYKGGLMAMSMKPAVHKQTGGRRRLRK